MNQVIKYCCAKCEKYAFAPLVAPPPSPTPYTAERYIEASSVTKAMYCDDVNLVLLCDDCFQVIMDEWYKRRPR